MPACPLAARVAAELADPAGRLDRELAAHLPGCLACRAAAAGAIRSWPTDRSPSGSLPEWLSAPSEDPTISEFQAEAIAAGRYADLELGPYLLLDRLGVGGMGEVYRARHRFLRRVDAVKTVKPEMAANPNAVKRFLREAEAAAKVRHPNVVHVYTADRAGAGYYIAMEFVQGSDLGKLVRAAGRLSVPEACEYVRQAAEGLHHAFVNGLVHRDVKPGNLLVTDQRNLVKVADFGLARAFAPDADASEFTAAGAILGTTDYMAPEQAEDARAADTRSDVYSLGCTLFHLLAGQPPFPGGSLRDKLNRHATAGVPPLADFRTDVPESVEAVLRKCVAKRPADRFQTPGELAAALRPVPVAVAASAGDLAPTGSFPPEAVPMALPVEAPAVTRTDAADETYDYAPPTAQAVRPTRPERRGRPWVWAVAGLLVIASAVGVVMQLTGGRKPDDGARTDPPRAAPGTDPKPGQKTGEKDLPKKDPNPPPAVAGPAPVPKSGTAGPWAFVGPCYSKRKDEVRTVGFLADGQIVAGRAGESNEGKDSGVIEGWPRECGGTPWAKRPADTIDYEFPIGVHHAVGLVTDQFRRFALPGVTALKGLSQDGSGLGGGRVDGVRGVSFTPDGKYVVGAVLPQGGKRKFRLVLEWKAATGEIQTGWQVATDKDLPAVSVDRTGDTVATGTEEGAVFVLATDRTRERKWEDVGDGGSHLAQVRAVAISPDGKRVYSAHEMDPLVHVWDVDGGKHAGGLRLNWRVFQMEVSPDGRWLLAAGEAVTVWDLNADPPRAYELAEHWAGGFHAAAFSPDSKRMAVGGQAQFSGRDDGTGVVWVWELNPSVAPPKAAPGGAWQPAGEFRSPRKDKVRAVGFGAKGELIAGREGEKNDGTDSGWWEVWPAGGGEPVRSERPKGLKPHARPRAVSARGDSVVYDNLTRYGTGDGFPALPPLNPDLSGWATGAVAASIDAAAFNSGSNEWPAGRYLIGSVTATTPEGNRRFVVMWDLETNRPLSAPRVETAEDIGAVAVDRDGGRVAARTLEGTVHFWDGKGFQRSWPTAAAPDKYPGVAITPDAKTVYAGHPKDEAIYAWDVKEDRRGIRLECPWQPSPMLVSPDGRWLVAGGTGVRVWDLSADPPKPIDLWKKEGGEFKAVAFSPDGTRLAAGGWVKTDEQGQGVGGAWVWELKPPGNPGVVPAPKAAPGGAWKPAGEFKSPRKGKVLAAGFGPKGEVIAGRGGENESGSDSGWWEVWPPAGGTPTAVRPEGTIDYEIPAGVAPGGRFVVSDRLRRWDPANGFKPLPPLAGDLTGYVTGGRADRMDGTGFSADGRFVVGGVNPVGGSGKYRLMVEWEAETGKIRTALQVPNEKDFCAVASDRGGTHLAGWSADGFVRVRDTNKLRQDLETGPTKDMGSGVAITPDGKTVYAGHAGDKAIYAWNVKDGTRGGKLDCPWQPYPMRLSPDGRWLVAAGYGVRVWDLFADPPKSVDLWKVWDGEFTAVAFSEDSKRLVVGGWTQPTAESKGVSGVWVWDLKP